MKIDKIFKFIRRQNVAFIASIDGDGFPNQKAMLPPRKIEDNRLFYFSTNTSSMRVEQYRKNPYASLYFFHKGFIRYKGVMLKGTMEVIEDADVKKSLWKTGDKIFYKQGVSDPDYCVLKFTAYEGRYYCDLKTENFSLT